MILCKKILLKFLRFIFLLGVVIVFAMTLFHYSPVDPIRNYLQSLHAEVSSEFRENMLKRFSLDLSLSEKIINYFKMLFKGDLGESLLYQENVLEVIKKRFFISFPILFLGHIFSFVLGTLLGIFSALYEKTKIDKILTTLSYAFSTTPPFWVAIVLLAIFAVKFPLFPFCCAYSINHAAGETVLFSERIYHAILPLLSLAILNSSSLLLFTREKVCEIKQKEFYFYLRTMGEKEVSIIFKHSLKNILIPSVTLQLSLIGELIGGMVVIEEVFNYPGLGKLITSSALKGDIPLLMGIIILTSVLIFIGNICSDLFLYLADPKLRKAR